MQVSKCCLSLCVCAATAQYLTLPLLFSDYECNSYIVIVLGDMSLVMYTCNPIIMSPVLMVSSAQHRPQVYSQYSGIL